jgi:hypothetical protein
MRKLIFLLLISVGRDGAAQALSVRDSLRLWFSAKPSLNMSLDGRSSFIGASPASVLGGRIGLDYGKVGLYGGLYTLRRRIENLQSRKPGDTVYRRLGMTYASATFEYLLHKDPRWQFKIPVQLGLGVATRTLLRNGTPTETSRVPMVPLEAQICALYRLTRYLGISGGIGFRMANGGGPSYNGSIYSFGLTLFSGTLYNDLKKYREDGTPLRLF